MSGRQIERFVNNINSLHSNNVKDVLATLYTEDVIFIDPVKSIEGLSELTQYFDQLYKNVSSCHFKLSDCLPDNHHHSLQWIMRLQHQKIANNKEIYLEGATFLKYRGDKVSYHRDYYDLGALVYERIPLLGAVVKRVRHAI